MAAIPVQQDRPRGQIAGKETLVLGLSFANLDKFRAEPGDTFIRISGDEVGLPVDIMIISGETEAHWSGYQGDHQQTTKELTFGATERTNPMSEMLPIPLEEQIDELHRELQIRRRVYPRFVADGKMTQAKADRQIAALEAAAQSLQLLKGLEQ